MAVGTDAPEVEGVQLFRVGEGGEEGTVFAALGAKDFNDAADVLDFGAVGGDGVGVVVEQDDGVGAWWIGGQGLRGGGADPIGHLVFTGGVEGCGEGGGREGAQQERASRG